MRRKLIIISVILMIIRELSCEQSLNENESSLETNPSNPSEHSNEFNTSKETSNLPTQSTSAVTNSNINSSTVPDTIKDSILNTTISIASENTNYSRTNFISTTQTIPVIKNSERTNNSNAEVTTLEKPNNDTHNNEVTTSNSTFLESSNEGNSEIDHTTKKPTYVKEEETTTDTTVSESSTKLTEIPTTENSTISTETTSQPVLDCQLKNTSYVINELNILTVFWELNEESYCNSSNVSIVLINQACIDKCNSEIPECSECKKEQQIPASILNFTFSEEIIPCANYQYIIKLFGSSSDSINQTISTNDLRYLISKTPNIKSITDKTITLEVILNDPESLCQNNMYYVKCEVNDKEVFSKESHEQTIVIENLEPRQNYSCSTRIKHGNTTWSEYSESLIITTNATDCNLQNATHYVNDQSNNLTMTWVTNGSEMCETAFVRIELINRNCAEKCNDHCSCNQIYQLKANDLKFNFPDSLIPCATYSYQIEIINSTFSTPFNSSFNAFRNYAEIENLQITDVEEIDDPKKLNMFLTWDYKNQECSETFTVSARGQGNFFEYSGPQNSYTFPNLEACEEFNINIFIKDHPEINISATHTMKRVTPSEIRNLSLSQENSNNIKIAWVAPIYGAKCIERYFIRVKNSMNITDRNISETTYIISEVIACDDYLITVSINAPVHDNENSETTTLTSHPTTSTIRTTTFSPSISPAINFIYESSINASIKTEPRQFVQPQHLQLNKQTDKSLSFNVYPTKDDKNKCPITQYHVECRSKQFENRSISASNTINTVEVDGLDPFHHYDCRGAIENESNVKSDWSYVSNFTTNAGIPNAPKIDIAQGTLNSTSFTVKWKEPTSPKGIIKQYDVYIKFVKFEYDSPSYCSDPVTGENKTLLVEDLDPSLLSYTFKNGKPSSTYTTQIRASNQAYDGEFSSSETRTTKPGPSDELQNFTVFKNEIKLNESYSKTIYIEFNYPCRANGPLQKFLIEFKSTKNSFSKTILYEKEETKYTYSLEIDELEPDISYTIYGYAFGENNIKGKDVIVRDFKINAGIPVPVPKDHIKLEPESSTTSISISIPNELFDSKVGRISHARIFLLEWSCSNMTSNRGFNTDDQPKHLVWEEAMAHKCIPEYDTGIVIVNGDNKTRERIGTEAFCEELSLCNGKLRPGTTYGLTFRLYTETGYAETDYFQIHTNKEVPIIAISIIILSILCLVFLIGFYISCRRTQELRRSAIDSPYDRKDISVQNFQSYHQLMSKNENEKIKEEYKAVQYFSESLDRAYIASRANERLNRYINIYPYDSTRVVLNDDEYENDYINASFINGYYYPKEYIAAQGPKPETVLDFWRMVVQHRTESIVMLTSLVENNKVKCHEYFPRLNGRLTSGSITITCTKEQNFPTYIKRILVVEKNGVKLSVNHYYFSMWPDHGCPNNASDLIEFVKIVRNERQKPGETFVVHCSAGVGRTGTFIAVDIMMQRIRKENKINIFDLVKQLRSQRMKMVQSCDQYVFLYTAALELINISRRANVLQNIRDTVLKFVNELEIPERWKRHENTRENSPKTVIESAM